MASMIFGIGSMIEHGILLVELPEELYIPG